MSEALTLFDMEQTKPDLSPPDDQQRRLEDIGGSYIPDFISEQDESSLLEEIDTKRWICDLRRRVQHYGYRYNYKERGISCEDNIGALPTWADSVLNELTKKQVFSQKPDQIIVNEYQPGQGIAPHVDRNCFGPTLASLSLGSACMMRLEHHKDKDKQFDIILEPRSLVVFAEESRYQWKHSIAARQNDKIAKIIYPRKRRVSLTFRTVLLPEKDAKSRKREAPALQP